MVMINHILWKNVSILIQIYVSRISAIGNYLNFKPTKHVQSKSLMLIHQTLAETRFIPLTNLNGDLSEKSKVSRREEWKTGESFLSPQKACVSSHHKVSENKWPERNFYRRLQLIILTPKRRQLLSEFQQKFTRKMGKILKMEELQNFLLN